jgi:hypothetical protein
MAALTEAHVRCRDRSVLEGSDQIQNASRSDDSKHLTMISATWQPYSTLDNDLAPFPMQWWTHQVVTSSL